MMVLLVATWLLLPSHERIPRLPSNTTRQDAEGRASAWPTGILSFQEHFLPAVDHYQRQNTRVALERKLPRSSNNPH